MPAPRSPIATTTALTAAPAPAKTGEAVRLIVVVRGAGGEPPSGVVHVSDGALTLGSAALSDGQATLAVRLRSGGIHVLQAEFAGANGSAPSRGAFELMVLEPTLAELWVTPAEAGGLTLTARVRGLSGATPCTGAVLFECDGEPLGCADLTAGEAAIVRALPSGGHEVIAVYGGDGRHSGARSRALRMECG